MCIVIKTGGVVGFVGQVEKFFFLQLLSSGGGVPVVHWQIAWKGRAP